MAYWQNKKTGEIRNQIGSKGYREWNQISESQVRQIEMDKTISEAKAYYQPGGGFGKGVEAGLERGRTKAMASGMQGLVSAGLAGTTMAGGLGKKYEEEVAAPTRFNVEDQRAQALSGIAMQQAGMSQQSNLATTQMQFQAGQSTQQNSLQKYIAELQATLQRESMAYSGPAMKAPTNSGNAQQFPTLYNSGGDVNMSSVPDLMGNSTSGWSPPREYSPSMVGQSSWAQRGSLGS